MVVFFVLYGEGCHKPEKDPRTGPQLVRTIAVQPVKDNSQSYTGVVVARVQSDLGFRVAGKITNRLVDVGQTVRAGQRLLKIDTTDFTHTITAQVEDIAAAQARADQAVADEERYRGLVTTGAVSASLYGQVKSAADAALAQLSAARAQAQIAKDQAAYTELVADADGVVVQTLAEPGQVVGAGQIVIRLAHSGPREAAVNLPETVRPALGSIASASLYGSNTQSAPARLRQLSDASDPLTRTFEARYVLQGNAARAPLGSTVNISILKRGTSHSVEIPLASMTDPGAGPGVWVFDPGTSKVAFRPVQVTALGSEVATVVSNHWRSACRN